jgi:hypothetical protein
MDGAVPKMWSQQTLPGTHLRPHILGILPLYGFILHVRRLIGITINISQMDYNLTLHISDMDDLISCEGGHGSPDRICFDSSVRKVNAPHKFVDDFV